MSQVKEYIPNAGPLARPGDSRGVNMLSRLRTCLGAHGILHLDAKVKQGTRSFHRSFCGFVIWVKMTDGYVVSGCRPHHTLAEFRAGRPLRDHLPFPSAR